MTMNRACEVCGRPTRRKSLCEAHYYRLRRTGSLGTEGIWDKRDPGCAVPGCDGKHRARGFCDKHYQHARSYGTPLPLGHPTGPEHPGWTEHPTYAAVHQRLRSQRGPANQHTCPCGRPARQWAVDHGRARWMEPWPYTDDLAAYLALCVSCHKIMDLARSGRQGGGVCYTIGV